MSDSTEDFSTFFKPPTKPTLKFDDAVRFFKGVAPKARCTTCNSKTWEIPISDNDDSLCLLQDSGMTRTGEQVYNLYIECRNCGWIRGHRVGAIQQWLSTNPKDQIQEQQEDDE
ncbi:hypothetical protein [Pseudomonas sp. S31]|uniref:hypothetical protein n=1 Tax=Pseudomonas sp. S31 TaxID=1564473 RepID=UPI001912E722|nr:hypothetical protein [Pseudomonas sp. S31]